MENKLDTQRLETYYWRLTRDMSERQVFLFKIFLRGFYLEFAMCHDSVYTRGTEADLIGDALELFNETHDMQRVKFNLHIDKSPTFN